MVRFVAPVWENDVMFWSIHAAKGGAGASVIAAALALELAQREPWATRHGIILIDFGGDQPDILGVDVERRYGVADWLTSPDPVEVSALEGLLVPVQAGLSLLPVGRSELTNDVGSVDPGRVAELVNGLGEMGTVVADLGVIGSDATSPRALIGAASTRGTLVVRPCYLALRRATRLPISVDSVVEVFEDGRALRTLDVEAVIQMAVSARVRVDPAIARAVDSGTLVSRRPRGLRRFVQDMVAEFEDGRNDIGAFVAETGRRRNLVPVAGRVDSW